MNKKFQFAFVCGVALAAVTLSQQSVKADTTTEGQATEQVAKSQAVAQAPTTQTTTTEDQNQESVANDDQTQVAQSNDQQATQPSQTTEDNTQAAQPEAQDSSAQATTQANATASNITPLKGIVTTKGYTQLYAQDGSVISNRVLGGNTAWLTDQKLVYNGQTYYRVATNEYANANNVVLTYGHQANGVVRVKSWGAASYSRNEAGFYKNGQANYAANSVWKYDRTDSSNGRTYYQIGNDIWLNSDDSAVGPAYQNPNGWLQIQNSQIKPSGGSVGYDLYNGVEGVKVWLVRRYFGYSNAHTIYDGSVASSVRSLQARKGLPVTGVVNLATWKAMGYSEADWYGIDSYVAPLQTNITSTRSQHIEAMINQAYKYLGKTWISGAASMPAYGVDCSGLVTQALYASGVDSAPISNIQHAQPGHEWNSRDYWADARIPHINFNNRQRGDLIFFTDPSTGIIWHVGILLNRDTMIESWPYAVQVHSIYGNRGNIAGVKRVFS
ncbi:C40 family peptidase [Companilactobacillus sp. HBUAS56275]|uniref:C40 family peptidase n=1 Tax=Candidatus Companilactobacillus pullicola TaxID=2838523 RepID=A0A9D2CND7_9LACO|nr:C40 family peptidase [Candidatus Companilactobacillus pullicola]